MARPLYANYARTTLSADLTAVATSATVADASQFPTISSGNYYYLVLVRLSDNAKEIVKVTSATGNVLTISRAQESTIALAFSALDRAELWVTAATLTELLALYSLLASIVNDLTTGGTAVPLSAEQGKTLKGLVDLKVAIASIVNDLTTGGVAVPLSAEQGKTLKGLVDLKVAIASIVNDLTTGGTAVPLSAEQGKVLGSRLILADKRQTVLTGAASAGVPDFLGAVGKTVVASCTATALVVTGAAGYDERGPVDYVGEFTADQTWDDGDLTDSATNYLYLDYNTGSGTWTTGASTLAPVYSHVAPTTTSGQHWFDLNAMKMYVYDGAWTEKVRVFVGECVTDGTGAVTSVTEYAFRGHYDSGWFVSANATLYTKTHNLGVSEENIAATLLIRQSDAYSSELCYAMAEGGGSQYRGSAASLSRLTAKVWTGDNYVSTGASDDGVGGGTTKLGSFTDVSQTAGQLRLVLRRAW